VLRYVVGVVVLDLMVVPGDDPGERGVRRLQVRVVAVQGVAAPVAGELRGLARVVSAHVAARGVVLVRPVLVDVVAEVHDEVEILPGHVPVGRVVTVFELLTGGEGEGELAHRPSDWGTVDVRPTGLVSAPALKR